MIEHPVTLALALAVALGWVLEKLPPIIDSFRGQTLTDEEIAERVKREVDLQLSERIGEIIRERQ